ncbi:hypothetical protein [Mycobacterium sp. URHB0044]|uniref:hypothetical protein n=1 Tax=Mycobacterium sp. URHB0044 TaxID=1380386 RepID=UPI000687954A|nr:hypothetical protein [Mycobacterium sp. URHB0044]
MPDFTYLLDKFEAAEIPNDPFPHVYIDNLLSEADFAAVVQSPDVTLPQAANVDAMFSSLDAASYQPIEFPGCTKSRQEYVQWLETAVKPKNTHAACEGKGMALRCATPQSDAVRSLDAFFQSPEWSELLIAKFGVSAPTVLDCGLQKYLNGYEISPHPDIRQKALTWMLNVNPGQSDDADYHTHYMTLKPEWSFVADFWRDNPDAETCWIPWAWCDTQKRQTANNSIVIFSPRHDTLHAVRAHYDHLPAQRTQFYGNLWYKPAPLTFRPQFQDFAGGSAPVLSRSGGYVLKSATSRIRSRLMGWAPAR